MTRFFASMALTACACAVLGAQQPVFRGASDVVRVFATVTDRDGRLVTTLTRDHFEVRDEGNRLPPGCCNLGGDRLDQRRSIDQRDASALAGRVNRDLLADALGSPGYDHALASEARYGAHLRGSDGENFS